MKIDLEATMSYLMQNKKGLILGVANDHSISWGVAKVLAAQGAELGAYDIRVNAKAERGVQSRAH